MKKVNAVRNYIAIAALLFSSLAARGATDVEAGPRGGRLLQTESPRPEFFVEKDRTVSIAFYDQDKKQVAPAGQSIRAIAEARAGRTTLEFEKRGDLLVSKTPLPEGSGYTVVVQYRPNGEGRPKNFRIPLILETCAGCSHAEYACTCDE